MREGARCATRAWWTQGSLPPRYTRHTRIDIPASLALWGLVIAGIPIDHRWPVRILITSAFTALPNIAPYTVRDTVRGGVLMNYRR